MFRAPAFSCAPSKTNPTNGKYQFDSWVNGGSVCRHPVSLAATIYICIYHPPLKTYLDIIDISYIWFCQQWGTLVVHPYMQNAMFAFTMILGGRYIIYPPRESGYCRYRPRLRLGRYLQYPDYLGRYIISIYQVLGFRINLYVVSPFSLILAVIVGTRNLILEKSSLLTRTEFCCYRCGVIPSLDFVSNDCRSRWK